MQTKINVDGLLQLLKFLSGLTTSLIGSTGEVEQLTICAAALFIGYASVHTVALVGYQVHVPRLSPILHT